jgi:hypothetical protein
MVGKREIAAAQLQDTGDLCPNSYEMFVSSVPQSSRKTLGRPTGAWLPQFPDLAHKIAFFRRNSLKLAEKRRPA